MFTKNLSLLFAVGLFLFSYQSVQAQKTLMKEYNNSEEVKKSWRIEWGILTGAGVSNVLRPQENPTLEMPETMNAYEIASVYSDEDFENLEINQYNESDLINYLDDIDVESLMLTN